MTFYVQISTVVASQIAIDYSLLLVGISTALKPVSIKRAEHRH